MLRKHILCGFCTPDHNLYLHINGKSIEAAETMRFLGVTRPKINMDSLQIKDMLCDKASVSFDVLKLLYFGLVQSILQYGLIF